MTDFLDEQHAQVALTLLRANATLKVFDGAVDPPWPGPPYLLVYTSVAWSADAEAAGSSLDHTHATCTVTWLVHCIGETAAACRAQTMQARASLVDVLPVIATRSCFRITEDDDQIPVKDETTGSPVMDAVLTFSMVSVPG